MKVKSSLKKLSTSNFSLLTAKTGFTLIEILLIIVVVSIAIPALLIMVGQEAGFGVESELRVTATNAAQALMEAIKAKCFDETSVSGTTCIQTAAGGALGINGGETAGNPATYDDVDDYNAGVPDANVGGVTYSRSVAVCYVPSVNLNDTSTCNTATDYKQIQVTITPLATAGSSSVTLTTVVTNY